MRDDRTAVLTKSTRSWAMGDMRDISVSDSVRHDKPVNDQTRVGEDGHGSGALGAKDGVGGPGAVREPHVYHVHSMRLWAIHLWFRPA